ncbi:MAG: hypothetical protein WCQ41_03510 [Bacillota bacterium]
MIRVVVFGIKIQDETDLLMTHSYLEGFEGDFDVRISFGEADEVPDAKGRRLILKIKDLADYYFCDGKEIVINAAAGAKRSDIATVLYGTGLGTILHQRGITALHASAVATARGGIIFLGAQGSGKSTIAAGLSQKGCPILADDVCAISGELEIMPGFSRSKLTSESYLKCICDKLPEEMDLPAVGKYLAPKTEGADADKIFGVCLLEETDGLECVISPVHGTERLKILLENIYRPAVENLYIEPREKFEKYTEIASSARFFRILRPKGFENFDLLIEKLLLVLG